MFDGSPLVGIGLTTSGPGLIVAMMLEIALIAGGVLFWLRRNKKAA